MMFKKLVNLNFFAFLLILINQNSFGQLLPANRFYNPDVIGSFIWDNTPSNGVVNNGNGTWNSTDLNWLLIPSGANKTWISGRNATFGGNPGIGAAGMVTVSGTQNVKSLFFRNTPSGNFTLTAGILNLQGGLIVTDQDATIASTTQGGGNFIKRGDAKLTLTGNNTFTGSITVSQGGLYLGSSTAIGLTSVILGDATTNNSNVEWRWAGGFTPSNNITVTNQGTGIVTLGAYSVGTNTEHSGNINISRDVTFYDASNDRSTFTGVISGTADYINIDGTGTWNSSTGQVARVTFRNNNTFVATIKILANKAFQFDGSNAVNNNTFENNGSLVLNVGANGIASLGGLNGASTGICEIHPQVAGPQTFSIGNNNADGNYNGIFRNGSGGKVVNIIKTGTGTQLFNGTSTNTGTTIVNNGV